jgi:para-aminobenzoate synthetase component 1
VPLQAVQLPITDSFVELFRRCKDEPMALFLDSCDHTAGQWDFIFRQPQQVVTASPQWPEVLERALKSLPVYQGPSQLPFQGGLAGAWSYDAGRALEAIPAKAQTDISLPELCVGLYTQALMRNRKTGETWLLAPIEELEALQTFWLTPPDTKPQPTTFQLLTTWQSNMSAVEYADKFAQVQTYLRAGDCYQINLAQRFSNLYAGDTWNAYELLRKNNNAPFSAFMQLENGSLLSLSPERFLAIDEHGNVETKPIKGTRPRAIDSIQDQQLAAELQSSPKDRAENVMIVDLLRNDLSRLCIPGSVNVPKLFAIESYPAVHHLVSTVTGKLTSTNYNIQLFAACFPGGSITGAPKIRAMEIIDELEPHRRSFYCGSFGYFSQHGRADTSIAIRTLVAMRSERLHDVQQGTIHCWAGGGLVADSDCANEYQETFDKVARITPVLTQQFGTHQS